MKIKIIFSYSCEDADWGESSQASAQDALQALKRRTMTKRLGKSVVLSTVGQTDSDDSRGEPLLSEKISAQHP